MFHPVVGRICICWALIVSANAGRARDYFTEVFNGDFDLSYTTFTFKPDHSSNGYAVCRLPATEFPTPPDFGTVINNNAGAAVFYRTMPFFGQLYRAVALNANGSISYSDGTIGFVDPAVTLSNHFSLPRISPWLGTLGTEASRPVLYHVLSNRLTFTWTNAPDGANGGSNSMQLELFFDGVIRFTYLRMDAVHGIVGLSPGHGVPADFSESNLSGLGCAGLALHELVWSTPPSSVQPGQSFAASLSGRDAFNLDFPVNGPVRLGAGRPGTVVFHTDFEQGPAGFTFTNLYNFESNAWHLSTYRGTQVGHSPTHSMYFGYNDSGLSDPPGSAGRLVSPLLDLRNVYPPVTLSFSHSLNNAGAVVEVREEGQTVTSWLMEFGPTGSQWERPLLDLSFYAGRQIRVLFAATGPSGSAWQNSAWLVDDITLTGTTSSIPITPSLASFTGNTWSDNISVSAPGEGLVLIATHTNGVYGLSSPFNVTAPNDLILGAEVTQPYLSLGSTGSINIVVSNTGPNFSSSVVVTNQLPPGVTLGNVAVSQGFFSVVGNRLLLNFGGIAGSGHALAAFEFTPTAGGTMAFTSTVGRAESETFLENNQRVGTVAVGGPIVNLFGGASVNEGGTNVIFLLQLEAPVPAPVTVQFTTTSGTAVAGEDFVATNGVAMFAPGVTNVEVRVAIIDDDLFEVRPHSFEVPDSQNDPPEYFFLDLTSATNASIGVTRASATILENEPVPQLLVFVTNRLEGNTGTNLVPVLFQLTGRAAQPVDVSYSTETGVSFHRERSGYTLFGTASRVTTSAGGQDYVDVPALTGFDFAAGETQHVAYVQVIGDTTSEPDEFFTIASTSFYLRRRECCAPHPLYYTFTDVTIIDDDPPVFAVDDYRVVAENCTNNSALDPGEMVTVQLRVRNVGYNACSSSNLVATLLAGGGVLSPSGPQVYGAMCGGAPEVWRPFTFTVAAACGGVVTATLAFSDNGTNLGTAPLLIPVGARTRVLNENFDSTAMPNLPAGWPQGISFPWITTNEPSAGTNQFAHNDIGGYSSGAATSLVSPPFVPSSTSVWLRIRHRYETTTINAGGFLRIVSDSGGPVLASFIGSSRGWAVSQFQVPVSIGSTQRVSFELFNLPGALTATWDVDSVEVFDGPSLCCDGGAPMLMSVKRSGNSTVLQWTSESNRTYQLQFRPSLHSAQTWNDAGAAVLAKGPLTAQTNVSSASNGFYRVRLNP